MVELVIVVLVIGVLAGAAMPVFVDSLLLHRVESAARRLKADLELARQTARLTSAAQTVTFAASAYTLSGVSSLDNPNAAYRVDLAATPYEIAFVALDVEGDEDIISFDGYGRPTSEADITLRLGNHQRTVILDEFGEVTISDE